MLTQEGQKALQIDRRPAVWEAHGFARYLTMTHRNAHISIGLGVRHVRENQIAGDLDPSPCKDEYVGTGFIVSTPYLA